jgi:hypothetical protein
LIAIFRKNIYLNSILLLPYIALLRLKTLVTPVAINQGSQEGFLVNTVLNLIPTGLAQSILSICIIFIDTLLINRMVIKNHLSKENTLVAGALFGLFISISPDMLPLSGVLLSSPFVILSIQAIFNSYNNIKASDELFLSGFYMSVAALLYFPLFYFLPFTIIAFFIMRSFDTVEKIQHLVGWCTPIFLLSVWEYFIGAKSFTVLSYAYRKVGSSHLLEGFFLKDAILLLFVLLFVFIFLISYSTYSHKKIIAGQKRVSILYWFVLFTGISSFLFLPIQLNHLILFCIPLSIFFTLNLLEYKNRIIPELYLLFFLIILVILHLELIKF